MHAPKKYHDQDHLLWHNVLPANKFDFGWYHCDRLSRQMRLSRHCSRKQSPCQMKAVVVATKRVNYWSAAKYVLDLIVHAHLRMLASSGLFGLVTPLEASSASHASQWTSIYEPSWKPLSSRVLYSPCIGAQRGKSRLGMQVKGNDCYSAAT